MNPSRTLHLLFLLTVLTAPALRGDPTADGLYARFQTTLGTWWCKLEYERAPRTVANFVTLAEGTRPWVNYLRPGIVQRPFYTNITFHRVDSGFVIQGGSPNGAGTDDPGYVFNDEFNPQLRHSTAGILSMANSGPNSNGSQFFITLTNTPHLDNRHSVFGSVVEGLDVVFTIGAVPVNTNDVPLTPVVIQSVTIRRNGAAAQAFNPAAVVPPLPAVLDVPAAIGLVSTNLSIVWEGRAQDGFNIVYGTNLLSWRAAFVGVAPSNSVYSLPTRSFISTNSPAGYFRVFGFPFDD